MSTRYLKTTYCFIATCCVVWIVMQTSCTIVKKNALQDLPEGMYTISGKSDRSFLASPDSFQKEAVKKIQLYQEDSLYFLVPGSPVKGTVHLLPGKSRAVVLCKSGFDFDVFTTPFKFRPVTSSLPQQLNTNFNGSFYFGYRSDRFSIKRTSLSDNITRDYFTKAGIGIGAFVGVGTAFVNPISMRNNIDYEYDAVAIDYGIAVLLGLKNFSTGISVGFDFLTDRNRKQWVYQHKPWVGIFIGLNLN
ncbi:MAG TPA: hypothetical protein DHW64_01480 [Chitinophagaceae bacterium]|nr:hypothetical protein [Chitinophagaceae bacterium]